MNADRRTLLLGGLALSSCATTAGPSAPGGAANVAHLGDYAAFTADHPADEIIDLWPGPAPGGANIALVQETIERPNDQNLRDRAVLRPTHPTLSVFRPARPNGAAMLIIPGGGYARVVVDKEGFECARWFAAQGVTCFVLLYRLPSQGWAAGPDIGLQDAQRAMRLIRARAAQYGIDAQRIAAMGFSAGGHVCSSLATRWDAAIAAPLDAIDAEPARPALTTLVYPVITMSTGAHAGSRDNLLGPAPTPAEIAANSPDQHARPDMAPTLLIHAANDSTVPVENSILMFRAVRAANARAELHIFEEGEHGFGLRFLRGQPAAVWPELVLRWAQKHGVFGA